MPVEMVMKYPISVEHDRDIRSREFILCITHAKTEIVSHGAIAGSSEVQTFDQNNTSTCIRVPFEEVGMFALNLVNNLAASGVQLPSMNGEVKRMEDMLKAQAEEIKFLRALVNKSVTYHTSFGEPIEAVAEETRR